MIKDKVNEYGCDKLGHDTFFDETQAPSCPDCGLEITAVVPDDEDR